MILESRNHGRVEVLIVSCPINIKRGGETLAPRHGRGPCTVLSPTPSPGVAEETETETQTDASNY